MTIEFEKFAYEAVTDFLRLVASEDIELLAERYAISGAIFEEIVDAVRPWSHLQLKAPQREDRTLHHGRQLLEVFARENSAPDALQTWGLECKLLEGSKITDLTLCADVYLTSDGSAKFDFRLIEVM